MQAMRAAGSDWDVAGIVEPDAKRRTATASAKTYSGVPLVAEAALLQMRDVKAVAVETAIEDSCATALRVLRAGKHVHLDKPGALDHAEFTAMRREAEQRGLTVQMGYMLRYNPAFELLFRAVREGWLGQVMEIDAVMGKLAAAGLRAEIKALPGGGMFELGCHVIDARSPRRHGPVADMRPMILRARPRVSRILMHRGEKYVLLPMHDGLGAVAVMRVKIPNRDAGRPEIPLGVNRRDRDLIQITKAHRLTGRRMVARWTHQRKRRPTGLARMPGRCDGRSHGRARMVLNPGKIGRIRIKITRLPHAFQVRRSVRKEQQLIGRRLTFGDTPLPIRMRLPQMRLGPHNARGLLRTQGGAIGGAARIVQDDHEMMLLEHA